MEAATATRSRTSLRWSVAAALTTALLCGSAPVSAAPRSPDLVVRSLQAAPADASRLEGSLFVANAGRRVSRSSVVRVTAGNTRVIAQARVAVPGVRRGRARRVTFVVAGASGATWIRACADARRRVRERRERNNCSRAAITSPPAAFPTAPLLAEPAPVTPADTPPPPTRLVHGAHSLQPGEGLEPGERITSPDAHYALTMMDDGSLAVSVLGRTLWQTPAGRPGSQAFMQPDGDLVVRTPEGEVLWRSATAGHPGARTELQNDADLVVKDDAGARLWATGTINDTLQTHEVLLPNQFLESARRRYWLAMQGDGNLVQYYGTRALWASQTDGHPGAYAVMQGDGNLVVYTAQDRAIWASQTGGTAGRRLSLQLDANLVIYTADGAKATWANGASNHTLATHEMMRTDDYLQSPDRRYLLVMQGDGNLVLYRDGVAQWSSGTHGKPGAHAVMQGDGNLVVYTSDQKAIWDSKTGGSAGRRMEVQNDGNLVVYSPSGHAVWARFGLDAPGVDGPHNFTNGAVADRAETRANGTWADQCLVFATNMIAEAGGPKYYFGLNTSTYQAQWAQRATQIGSIADARRGDIVQWGGGAGGNLLHTAIVTTSGANPSLIDSNWGNTEQVNRGSFSSRNISGSIYRIWRLGQV